MNQWPGLLSCGSAIPYDWKLMLNPSHLPDTGRLRKGMGDLMRFEWLRREVSYIISFHNPLDRT